MITAISEESRSNIISTSFDFTSDDEDTQSIILRKRQGLIGLNDPIVGLATASSAL